MFERAIAYTLLITAVTAQSFDPLMSGFVPPPVIWATVTTAADMDGDGDIDLVRGARWSWAAGGLELLTNDGEGRFTATTIAGSFGGADLITITAADLDGDGDADLLVGLTLDPTGAVDRLLRNDGNGVFVDVTGSHWGGNGLDRTDQILTFDVDGDGDLDVLCCNRYTNSKCGPWCGSPPSRLFRNDGAGHLSLLAMFISPAAPAFHNQAVVLDYDGDGRADILFAGRVPHVHRGLARTMHEGVRPVRARRVLARKGTEEAQAGLLPR